MFDFGNLLRFKLEQQGNLTALVAQNILSRKRKATVNGCVYERGKELGIYYF